MLFKWLQARRQRAKAKRIAELREEFEPLGDIQLKTVALGVIHHNLILGGYLSMTSRKEQERQEALVQVLKERGM